MATSVHTSAVQWSYSKTVQLSDLQGPCISWPSFSNNVTCLCIRHLSCFRGHPAFPVIKYQPKMFSLEMGQKPPPSKRSKQSLSLEKIGSELDSSSLSLVSVHGVTPKHREVWRVRQKRNFSRYSRIQKYNKFVPIPYTYHWNQPLL